MSKPDKDSRPNVLFVMTDQQRFDTIASLGCREALTPNLDRLVARGVACTNAYASCPVCVPARYGLMTGCEPSKTGWFTNWQDVPDVPANCGLYLAQVMGSLGYRTWGLGKFHTEPRDEPLGFELHEYSEELWPTEEIFRKDDYVKWLMERAPAFAHLEQVHGERTDMYYVPQCRPQPKELCSETWLALRAEEEIGRDDPRPYFGVVSFVQPHPPIAPPIPYNRMFDPDAMPGPTRGDPEIDRADDYLAWMNHAIWADDISDFQAKQIWARYHASISFVDECVGRILDAVERRPDADNTLICFFSDHGDHMGDHGAWQKESFFEASCRVPFVVCWPRHLAGGRRSGELVALTDLFGLATKAADAPQCRDGQDLLSVLQGAQPGRRRLFGLFGTPGTRQFKAMVREAEWKYIWLANGGKELLFNVAENPGETVCHVRSQPERVKHMRAALIEELRGRELTLSALAGDGLRQFAFESFHRVRIKQFARGVTDFGQGEVRSTGSAPGKVSLRV